MNKIREICRKIYFFLSIYVVLSVIKIIAKIRFFTAKPSFRQLSLNNLEEIMRRRPAKGRGSDYKYGEIDLYVRGFKRANLLLRHATSSSHNFLELGCGDGTILFHLMNMGKSVIGVDIVDWRSELVKRSGVPYIKANACNRLPFDDNSFDFVFSFASLEHFTDPEFSLREIIRVMRPLGRAYILFGPLWRSPDGLHNMAFLNIPYLHFLFSEETVKQAMEKLKLKNDEQIIYGCMTQPANMYSVSQYKCIWEKYATDYYNKLIYREMYDLTELGFIIKYPSLMKAKTKDFDDLIVSEMELLLEKKSE